VDASTCFRANTIGPGWICAGDNSSALDPLTGFGLAKAIAEGAVAGAIAAQRATKPDVTAALQIARDRERAAYLEARAKIYADAGKRFGTEFWNRRMQSVD